MATARNPELSVVARFVFPAVLRMCTASSITISFSRYQLFLCGFLMEIRHILAPTDFSGASTQAVTSAYELAQTVGAKLSLLHVIEVPAYAIEVSLPLERLEQDARRAPAHLPPDADAAHVAVTRLVAIGVPSRTIVATARAEQVDLIVMDTHGRNGRDPQR
jgi:nucleotide-binding universal stress UspA family protein